MYSGNPVRNYFKGDVSLNHGMRKLNRVHGINVSSDEGGKKRATTDWKVHNKQILCIESRC